LQFSLKVEEGGGGGGGGVEGERSSPVTNTTVYNRSIYKYNLIDVYKYNHIDVFINAFLESLGERKF
jgi:hypothetical protein